MNGGGSSVLITGRVQEVIREIKEITGKHSDDDVYAMLKECNMDPNETTQRLLYLDSFHEVTKKRDRKKTGIISGRVEQSRSTFGQGQAAKGVRGNYSSYPSRGVAGGRSMPVRKENGISSSMEKRSEISPTVPEKLVQNSPPLEKISEAFPTIPEKIVQNSPPLNIKKSYKMASMGGPWNASNGLGVNEHKRGKPAGINSTSANDSVVLPLQNPNLHSVVVKDKVNGAAAKSLTSAVVENGPCSAPAGKVLQATTTNALPAEVSKPNKQLSGQTTTPITVSSKISTMIVKGTPESVTGQTVSALDMKLAKVNVDPPQPHHVIFPDHIHVPDTVKAGLTFGSLDINYDQTEQVIDGRVGALKTQLVPETIPEKEDTAKETFMSNEGLSLTAQEGDVLVHSESPRHVVPEVLPLQKSVSFDAEAKYEQPTTQEENLLLQGAQNSLPLDPNFSLPSIQVMLSREIHQSEGPETQQNGKSQVTEAADSSSPEQQAVDVTTSNAQTSFQVSPPPFPFYAHGAAFPPNYFPYNPYFHPFYVASSMHQFLGGPTGFTQLPSTGNMYHLPSSAVSGVKLETTTTTTTPQGKPVMNAGKSSTPFVVPAGYGYTTNIPPVVTSGSNNNGTDEYTASSESSKESSIYTTMPQQGERPIVYLPASGRDMPSFHGHHPFYNGQQIVFAPPPHGIFPGIYPAMQAATASSNIQQQQQQQFSRYSPSMAGTGETGVLPSPSPSYQMPNQNGINSNTNYALQ